MQEADTDTDGAADADVDVDADKVRSQQMRRQHTQGPTIGIDKQG